MIFLVALGKSLKASAKLEAALMASVREEAL
jgi:hypothetical protein